ncbi:hypothetical protein [Streptomyces sp. NPDC047928]|uniref:hypothetical protein n=1 Tax=unclassified Streptomyces TaxID=2593676 RepID=UPI00371C0A1D
MTEEAAVPPYGEDEQRTGLFTMLEDHLDVPFTTALLGVEVTVRGVDLTPDGRLVALCARITDHFILRYRLPDGSTWWTGSSPDERT